MLQPKIIHFNRSVSIYKIMGKIQGSTKISLEKKKKVILQRFRNERFLREKRMLTGSLILMPAFFTWSSLQRGKKKKEFILLYLIVIILIFLIKHRKFCYLTTPTARNSLRRSSMLPLWIVNKAAAIWLMALAKQCMLLQCPEKVQIGFLVFLDDPKISKNT